MTPAQAAPAFVLENESRPAAGEEDHVVRVVAVRLGDGSAQMTVITGAHRDVGGGTGRRGQAGQAHDQADRQRQGQARASDRGSGHPLSVQAPGAGSITDNRDIYAAGVTSPACQG